jgi:hypothetical protein
MSLLSLGMSELKNNNGAKEQKQSYRRISARPALGAPPKR